MAMHCPQCLTEYREGFTECADCHVPLAVGPPPVPAAGMHDVDLVTVLETSDRFAVNLGKATLEDAGIEYVMEGDDSAERGLTGMTPMGAMAAQIQVESTRADEARDLLEPLRNPEPVGDEEAETS
jgi:Putative prokaryotic signal transducing protein